MINSHDVEINKALPNGYEPGNLYVISGEKNSGKTSFIRREWLHLMQNGTIISRNIGPGANKNIQVLISDDHELNWDSQRTLDHFVRLKNTASQRNIVVIATFCTCYGTNNQAAQQPSADFQYHIDIQNNSVGIVKNDVIQSNNTTQQKTSYKLPKFF